MDWGAEIGKARRKVKGRISWNQYEYFATDALRTTSTIEGWHRHFNKKNFTNPTLEHLFENFQLEKLRFDKILFDQVTTPN